MAWLRDGDDGERRSWHGMNQPKPKLPSYFHRSKRLKGLDEFEAPPWIGRVRFGDDRITVRQTWAIILLVAAIVGLAVGWWLAQSDRCMAIGAFKIGWC